MHSLKTHIQDIAKLPFILGIAVLLNVAVFILIQRLVSNENNLDIKLVDVNLVEFIRVQQKPEPLEPKQEIEELQQESPEEPPPPEIEQMEMEKPETVEMDLTMPDIDVPLSLSGTPYLGDAMKTAKNKSIGRSDLARPKIDTNVIPTLRIPPVYPARALRSGIEGVVTVEFTIATDGSVKDAIIVKATPPKIFDKAVLKAISKWKFNPDVVNGKAVEKRARQDVKFKLQR